MTALQLSGEGNPTMIAAAEALAAAAHAVALGTVYGCGIVEKGSGNWGYWILYSG